MRHELQNLCSQNTLITVYFLIKIYHQRFNGEMRKHKFCHSITYFKNTNFDSTDNSSQHEMLIADMMQQHFSRISTQTTLVRKHFVGDLIHLSVTVWLSWIQSSLMRHGYIQMVTSMYRITINGAAKVLMPMQKQAYTRYESGYGVLYHIRVRVTGPFFFKETTSVESYQLIIELFIVFRAGGTLPRVTAIWGRVLCRWFDNAVFKQIFWRPHYFLTTKQT